ncbi:MAG: Ig-like domain-containing protein, partial [Candidatus Angelobacter sp.]
MRIKNALVTGPLEVAPVLYMADGTEYQLPAVTVPTSGVVSVNINQALAQAPASVITHLSSFGSAGLTYRHASGGHLIASISMQDTSRSLVLSYPFTESPVSRRRSHSSPTVWEGIWWKHDADVQGFLAVSNATDHETQAKIRLISPSGMFAEPRIIALKAHSTQMLSLENVQGGLGANGDAGGIRVEHSSEPGAIAIAGGLLNAKEGYSANIPFVELVDSQAGPVTLGSAGIMVGKPDPMMRFPSATTFTPYLVLRNATAKSLPVALQIGYMTQSAPVSKQVTENLGPQTTKRVNLPDLLRTLGMKDLSGSINIGASYTGLPSDLVMASGSVDQTGNYVFEVEPQALSSTHKKLGNYWDLDAGSNTMYSLWNPTDKPQDVVVTLHYDNGSGKYKIPVRVGPQSSVMLDLKNIIESNAPDADGNVFPSNTSEGGATIESADGPTGQMNLIISGAVFNVVTGTCFGCCVPCCGVSDIYTDPSSDACSVGDTQQFQVVEEQCDGSTSEGEGSGWTSSNTAVATVNSSGLMTAVGPGSATLFLTENLPASSDCGEPLPGECPLTNFPASAPMTAATFTGVLTANDNFSGRSTTNFGIAEVINLSFSTNPAGTTAASLGGLQWTIVSGGGTLSNAGTDGTGQYTAPSSPASVVLRLADGQGNGSNYTITVIAPSGAHIVKDSNLRHTTG